MKTKEELVRLADDRLTPYATLQRISAVDLSNDIHAVCITPDEAIEAMFQYAAQEVAVKDREWRGRIQRQIENTKIALSEGTFASNWTRQHGYAIISVLNQLLEDNQ